MMRFAQRSRFCLLTFTLILLSWPSHAELTVNMTQAEENGFDIENFQTTLQSATESEILIQADSANVFADQFDLISLNAEQAQKACKNKQLINLNQLSSIKPLLKKSQFLFKNKNDCAVSYASYAMVIAYPLINMVTTRPETPADFFDVEHFPGIRALPDSPIGTLEWALMAYGIPLNEVYQLLSTKRGLKLAFAKLDSIKRHIVWWKNTDELKQLITDNRVSMAGGPHNLFFDLQFNQPMEILWKGQLLIEMKLGINAASKQQAQAEQVIQTLMSDSVQFKMAYEYALGPSNKQTLNTLALLPQAGQVLVFVPSYKKNMQDAIWMDYNWHETLSEIINAKFTEWRNQNSQ